MWELFDLSVEVSGISAMISGLTIQLDNAETDSLTPDVMMNALHGIQRHLDRISSDLEELSRGRKEKGDAA